MKWSSSKLALLRLCPHAWAEDHVRETKRPPHPALAGGRNAHDAVKRFVRVVIEDEPIDVHSIARAATPGTNAELADTLGILIRLQEELAEDPPPFSGPNVIHVEERLSTEIGPNVFEGTADLVEAYGRTCVVTDWKTHWKPESQEAFEADSQLPRYAMLVHDQDPKRFDEFVLRKRFVRYRGAVREMTLEPPAIEAVGWDLVTEIEEANAIVAKGGFGATPGDWCTLCSRTDTCPEVLGYLADSLVTTILDDDHATRLAGQMRAIDAHSAKLKRLLKAYLGSDHETGRVELAGGTYGYGPSRHKRADVDDVLDIWEAHEMPLNRHVLRVDVDELRRSTDRIPGNARRALRSAIDYYEEPDCRYRRAEREEGDT